MAQHERLLVTSRDIPEDFVDFYNEEVAKQCIHASSMEVLAGAAVEPYQENAENLNEGFQGNIQQGYDDAIIIQELFYLGLSKTIKH